MKILFILKTNATSGGSSTSKSGLTNSAKLIAERLNEFPHVRADIVQVKNENHILEVLTTHGPDIVIIEAVWITPAKLKHLVDKFQATRFITRVHSRLPFIAMEGNVIGWIKEYARVSDVAFNNKQTASDMELIGIENIYLPNIYSHIHHVPCEKQKHKHSYKIGCFGSIRPFKNQLPQAAAAIRFGDVRRSVVKFFMNTSGIEQNGEQVLKNIRSLFEGTRHKLVEIDWLDHHEFIKVLASMDASMQVSLTETFNLVTADSVLAHVPVVVSEQIDWLTGRKADPNSVSNIADVLEYVIDRRNEQIEDNINDLRIYNEQATLRWYKLTRHRD